MTIRTAEEADLPAIVEIFNAAVATRMATAVLEPVTLDERREWFHEHLPDRHPLFVFVIDDRVAGWLSVHPFITRCAYAGTAEVSVYVHPDFKRRGVAARLLRDVLTEAPRLGLTALVGLIFGHNEPSLQLFERCGFARWGLLPRVARLDDVDRDIVIVGQHLPVYSPTAPPRHPEPRRRSKDPSMTERFPRYNLQFTRALVREHKLRRRDPSAVFAARDDSCGCAA